jgi:hypothetical protein
MNKIFVTVTKKSFKKEVTQFIIFSDQLGLRALVAKSFTNYPHKVAKFIINKPPEVVNKCRITYYDIC